MSYIMHTEIQKKAAGTGSLLKLLPANYFFFEKSAISLG